MWLFQLYSIIVLALPPAYAVKGDYFPKGYFSSTSSQPTWAHGIDSFSKLASSLIDRSVKMLQGYVVYGTLEGGIPGHYTAIMASPPEYQSDLTLALFLEIMMSHNTGLSLNERKGIKLDFQEPKALQKGLEDLGRIYTNTSYDFPVWISANVLPGPVNAPEEFILDGREVINQTDEHHTLATLSLGWSTRFKPGGRYLPEHFDKMFHLLRESSNTSPVTFSLRAQLALNSVEEIKIFLEHPLIQSMWPTVTLWENEEDPPLTRKELDGFLEEIGEDRVFIDLPRILEDHDDGEKGDESETTTGGSGMNAKMISNLILAVFIVLATSFSFLF